MHVIQVSKTTRNLAPVFLRTLFRGHTPPETLYQSFIHVIQRLYSTRNRAPVFDDRYHCVIHLQKPCTSLFCTLSRCHTPLETLYQSFRHVIQGSLTSKHPVPVFCARFLVVIHHQKPCTSLYARYLGVSHHQKPCTSLLCKLSRCHTPPETLYQSFMHVIQVSKTTRNLAPVFLRTLFRGHTPPETLYQSFIHVIQRLYSTRNRAPVFDDRYHCVIHLQKPCTSLFCTLSRCHTPLETLYQSFRHVIQGSLTSKHPVPVFCARFLVVIHHQKPCTSLYARYLGVSHHQKPCTSL